MLNLVSVNKQKKGCTIQVSKQNMIQPIGVPTLTKLTRLLLSHFPLFFVGILLSMRIYGMYLQPQEMTFNLITEVIKI